MLVVPLVLLGKSFFAITIALGALAGALFEIDDRPRGRIKSLTLKVFSFALSSLSVELLCPCPLLPGIGLFVSTIVFVLRGGLGECFRFFLLCSHPGVHWMNIWPTALLPL
ncbi:FUSC family membrane protein [Desulforhopalus sp. IMCC35007]|uniref:FUSC family membrane protein n=1 Tax=Desulforhopalus sp. IMCC35007 TaxID=2569543 RepID=UPI00145C4FF6|nr:FUSC family membrane protein [Desulforhopalus sp. IMCC35007]